MAAKAFVGDIGTVILLDCGCDISAATITSIRVKKPDRTSYDWPAEIYSDNYIKYITVDGDFDQEGTYILQAYIEIPDWKGRGEPAKISIYA